MNYSEGVKRRCFDIVGYLKNNDDQSSHVGKLMGSCYNGLDSNLNYPSRME